MADIDVHYRGYGIRIAGDAFFKDPFTGKHSGGWRYIIKKNGKIVSEQCSLEHAKSLIDDFVKAGYRHPD
jgi:hypothetical protein